VYLSLVDNQGGGIHIQEEFKRTQIGMFRPIRMDHTNCLQVAIKSIQFNSLYSCVLFILQMIGIFFLTFIVKICSRLILYLEIGYEN
jgi:hypothetical protein